MDRIPTEITQEIGVLFEHEYVDAHTRKKKSADPYCQACQDSTLRHNNVGRMNEAIYTRCCIAGGGPAGVMLGFLLARMGIDVFVLEKHANFLRDFRGDTVHPSTLEIMHELGILDEFLKRPHQEVRELAGQVGQDTDRKSV